MERQELSLEKIREIALRTAKEILEEMGIEPNAKDYASKQYEMQFAIYHSIKKAANIKSE